jgi:hypothetical protein
MKKRYSTLLFLLVAFLMVGCAAQTPQKVNRNGDWAPQSDYQAYAKVVQEQETTFERFSIEGVDFIKIKGDNLKIAVRDEIAKPKGIKAPKKWYERLADSFDHTVATLAPPALKGWMGWLANDAFKFNQEQMVKDPIVVDQRHDTVTNNESNTETVEVVEQQSVEVIEVGDTYNGNVNQGTINNNPEPVDDDEVPVEVN